MRPAEANKKAINIKILASVMILLGIGVAFMYGASARAAEELFSLSRDHFFYRQLIYAILSFILILFLSRLNPELFFRLANLFLILAIAALVLTLIPGVGEKRNGSRRWISLGFFNFQASELAKIAIVLYLAKKLAQKENNLTSFSKDILPILLAIALVFSLIFIEDFSSSSIVLIVSLSLLFVAGAPIRYFIYLAVTGIPILYFFLMSFPHMKSRLSGYLKKFFHDEYIPYQENQAIKAIMNAQYFGSGPGIGSYHARVPESHTDFYFVSVVSDIGLLGGFLVLALYFFLYTNIFHQARHLIQKEHSYLVYGLGLLLIWQTVLNLAGVLGLLPIAGLPLPFLSYGGNSLISVSLAIGIILSLSRFQPKP
ncbi:MAG: FtsW/RodA/SpoVE family cell cycle protein [Spirochaetota bacterium]|nr:FtsW/RodA/SpoVE family cell cycle protein [Spirochaetota bacterium]